MVGNIQWFLAQFVAWITAPSENWRFFPLEDFIHPISQSQEQETGVGGGMF